MTPAMELKKTEYAERYDVKLLLLLSKFQGSMQMPTMAAMKPPRRIFFFASVTTKFVMGTSSGLQYIAGTVQ